VSERIGEKQQIFAYSSSPGCFLAQCKVKIPDSRSNTQKKYSCAFNYPLRNDEGLFKIEQKMWELLEKCA
jgi:hypothetical protein